MTAPFGINTGVPAVNDDPADDVAPMQVNFANINGYLAVDHVTPGTSGAGWHQQTTYLQPNVPALLPTGNITIAYSDPGTSAAYTPPAASTTPNYMFDNARGTFPLSCLRAFGVFAVNNTGAFPIAQTVNNGFNVATVSQTGPGGSNKFVVKLVSNATTNGTNNVIAIAWINTGITLSPFPQPFGAILNSSFALNILTITPPIAAGFAGGTLINFAILQF